MDKRRAYYEELDERTKKSLRSAEALNSEYDSKLADIDNEIAARRAEGAEELKHYRQAELKKAEAEAQQIIAEARAKAEEDRYKIIASARSEIADSVILTAEKLIRKNIDEDCTDLIDDMIRKVGENCG
jgi:F-type H+-transporting ATPase subunit b